MFRFLHAADLHIDSPLRGLSRYELAPAEAIRGATRRALVNLVDLAIAERVAFVLLAGDLYDSNWRDYNTAIFVAGQLGRLGAHGIAVFAIGGNHDAASSVARGLLPPPNLHVFAAGAPGSERIAAHSVAIHGQSFGERHEANNLALGFPPPLAGCFNIGLLHTSLDGRPGHAPYAPCSVEDLRSRGYDYWALGHVHQRETVSREPWIVFPGCIQGRHIRERGPKGCTLVEVEERHVVRVTHRVLDVVRWELCSVSLDDVRDYPALVGRLREALREATAASAGRLLALRVRIEGRSALADELLACSVQLQADLRAIVLELAAEQVWIEKVELAVQPLPSLDGGGELGEALAGLVTQLLAAERDGELLAELEGLILGLRAKLPAEAISEAVLPLDQPAYRDQLIEEAKALLLGRLQVHEAAP